jgi:hypothetical protein
VACAAAVATYPAVSAGRVSWLPPAIGAAGVGLLATALVVRRPWLVAWAVAVLGAEYGSWLALEGGGTNTRAPLVGAGLVLAAEFAYEAQEPPLGEPEPDLLLRRLVLLAATALAAILLGAAVLAVASVPVSGGVALTGAGVAAAVLALGIVAALAFGRR